MGKRLGSGVGGAREEIDEEEGMDMRVEDEEPRGSKSNKKRKLNKEPAAAEDQKTKKEKKKKKKIKGEKEEKTKTKKPKREKDTSRTKKKDAQSDSELEESEEEDSEDFSRDLRDTSEPEIAIEEAAEEQATVTIEGVEEEILTQHDVTRVEEEEGEESEEVIRSLDRWAQTLDPRLVQNLRKMGMESLFPIQAAVLPTVLSDFPPRRDVCVCAPTGSGKTLAYALPLAQRLLHGSQGYAVRRLRVLVLVPTRDLALQVKVVFDRLLVDTDLRVAVVIGQSSFVEEQKMLVPTAPSIPQCVAAPSDRILEPEGVSLVDILIATPGRLVDHIQETKGFTLEHLTHLVVDEADRLLMQRYQDWLNRVLMAAHGSRSGEIQVEPEFIRIDSRNPRTLHQQDRQSWRMTLTPPLRKLLFSATLTKNPAKIASLRLTNPRYFMSSTVPGRYRIPDTLTELLVMCKGSEKPLVLIGLLRSPALIDEGKRKSTLVFTASVEATHRLYRLLELMKVESVAEYSASLPQAKRSAILEDFRQGRVRTLICSDAMTRGMDIQGVQAVVNYDVPPHVKTYVHRVGRTARAGREGVSYTLLKSEEVYHFKEMLKKAEKSDEAKLPKKFKLDHDALVKPLKETYKESLVKLRELLGEEQKDSAQEKTAPFTRAVPSQRNPSHK